VLVTTDRSTDRELSASHQLTLSCGDAGQPPLISQVNVVINVIDIDDHAPRFSHAIYNCTVREHSRPLEVSAFCFVVTSFCVLSLLVSEKQTG